MKVAIVGSRSYSNYPEFKKRLEECIEKNALEVDVIISGGARGVDLMAKRWAKENNIPIIEYKPDYNAYPGYLAPIMRNTKIVEHSDVVIAYWNGESKGTLDSMTKATESGKRLVVINV